MQTTLANRVALTAVSVASVERFHVLKRQNED